MAEADIRHVIKQINRQFKGCLKQIQYQFIYKQLAVQETMSPKDFEEQYLILKHYETARIKHYLDRIKDKANQVSDYRSRFFEVEAVSLDSDIDENDTLGAIGPS